ncbi:cysteine-rich repeat secretory protein 55 [Amborella trichopoda]|uniref:Gnk2-homologous domain-containing protein n=1 Tax=Amborella trichopoda TaxID=13333 RepID=W1NKS3_AMBTC|nr:cysteine-rich repeat secretory protein 55 [Amborella trichopoda]ERM95834.1 hypothetical protein AMTR_s00060p00084230 [Amborella trichopoda]|eukprot:XP_006828418.1 cysteine-rich repeat secretory protein 55 [Amborella trichopoda]
MAKLLLCTLFTLALLQLSLGSDHTGEFCNSNKKISDKSTMTNIGLVLSELETKGPSNGFATASIGQGKERVYGLLQCRGDISPKDCSSCTSDATKQIRQLCPDEADARIWFDNCFLRYDTDDFMGELDTGYGIFYWNVQNVTEPERFAKELGDLMDKITAKAVEPGNKGFGSGKTKFAPFVTIYGLVQCTQDLPKLQCAQCLSIAISNFGGGGYCDGKKGCRVFYSSCSVRFEIYPFFLPLSFYTRDEVHASHAVYHKLRN